MNCSSLQDNLRFERKVEYCRFLKVKTPGAEFYWWEWHWRSDYSNLFEIRLLPARIQNICICIHTHICFYYFSNSHYRQTVLTHPSDPSWTKKNHKNPRNITKPPLNTCTAPSALLPGHDPPSEYDTNSRQSPHPDCSKTSSFSHNPDKMKRQPC